MGGLWIVSQEWWRVMGDALSLDPLGTEAWRDYRSLHLQMYGKTIGPLSFSYFRHTFYI